jgi:signal transduction histidine kinase
MASEARKKDVYMVNNLSGSLMVNADKEMINLVVRNLIHNAIKFTQPGDRIVADGAIIGNEVTLNLSDTGIGMTEEQLKNIFSRKMTTTNGTANEKGTGLGLQLCLDFIQMNKGKMEVHSRKGQGSVFSISLPVSEA